MIVYSHYLEIPRFGFVVEIVGSSFEVGLKHLALMILVLLGLLARVDSAGYSSVL